MGAQLLHKRIKILGRVACLGSDLYSLRFRRKYGYRLINQQKVRVDYWMEQLLNKAGPRPEIVRKYLARPDVYPLIENQATLPWIAEAEFEFLLMDSFSELTDQRFTHKTEGWSFCCHYSDLNHTSDFDQKFECQGLLHRDQIDVAYTNFFGWFETAHPGKEVVFVHFPTTLDERALYKERGKEILSVITRLQANKPYIKLLSIEDQFVDWNENDRFPYHFSKSTNTSFVAAWDRLDRC